MRRQTPCGDRLGLDQSMFEKLDKRGEQLKLKLSVMNFHVTSSVSKLIDVSQRFFRPDTNQSNIMHGSTAKQSSRLLLSITMPISLSTTPVSSRL
jgi:hypothetical protein